MLLKRIACAVPPDSRRSFAAAQAGWAALAGTPGFVGQVGGWRVDDPTEAVILAFWQDGRAYQRFMRDVHDDIHGRSKQAGTYVRAAISLLEVRDSIVGAATNLPAAIASAAFARIAECRVRPERRAHFIRCQREIWNPAMRDAGILGGAFTESVEDDCFMLVCTFWPDSQSHASFAASLLPSLRERAEVEADCTSVASRSFVVEPLWIVPVTSDDGAGRP